MLLTPHTRIHVHVVAWSARMAAGRFFFFYIFAPPSCAAVCSGLLLPSQDGFPRNLVQAAWLESVRATLCHALCILCVYIEEVRATAFQLTFSLCVSATLVSR